MEHFKLWSNNKMKTFLFEKDLHAFAKEKGIHDYVTLKLAPTDYDGENYDIQIHDELDGWMTDAALTKLTDGSWAWTEDFYSGSKGYPTQNGALKDFVAARRNKALEEYAGGGSPRYSVHDVYSPSELGLNVKDF